MKDLCLEELQKACMTTVFQIHHSMTLYFLLEIPPTVALACKPRSCLSQGNWLVIEMSMNVGYTLFHMRFFRHYRHHHPQIEPVRCLPYLNYLQQEPCPSHVHPHSSASYILLTLVLDCCTHQGT